MSSFFGKVTKFALNVQNSKTLQQAAVIYRSNKTSQVSVQDSIYVLVSSQTYESVRCRKIGEYKLVYETEETVVYQAKTHLIIGFRGSKTESDFLDSDTSLVRGELAKTVRFKRTWEECRPYLGSEKKITFTGHSLGGSLSVCFVAAQQGDAVIFNAGYPPQGWTVSEEEFRRYPIHSYTTDKDVVSLYGIGKYQENTILRTDVKMTPLEAHSLAIFKYSSISNI